MITFHPPQEFLDGYASGNLPSTTALAVNVHLRHCAQCAKDVKHIEHISGELLEDFANDTARALQQNRMDDLRAKVMQKVGGDKMSNVASVKPLNAQAESVPGGPLTRQEQKLLPQYLNHQARKRYAGLTWQNLTRSIQTAALGVQEDGASVELMDISPGASIWRHYHTGDEITVVLDGSFSDENGVYKPGDFLLRSGKQAHKPVGTRDGHCMCLIVHEGPVQFVSPWLAWMNPFFRLYYRNYQNRLASNPVPAVA